METLLGIIFFHLLVIVRAKQHDGESVPYFFTFFISLLLVIFVVYMMFIMEKPDF